MTIEDQIRDEKLQYDINRDTAKISTLSSGKIDKYDYLTGKDILPSKQQQIIEQAKFTYSSSEKTFEKQTKTIEDQGKNQIDALADLKPKEIKPRETKPNEYSDYFLNGLAKIQESYEPVDFNHLTYNVKDLRIPPISFFKSKGPMHISKGIHTGDTTLEDIEKEKMKLKRDLGRIKQEDPKDKSEEQKKIINNIKNLYNSREEVVRMYNNYAKNMSRNIYKSKQGTGLKKLTPKQMLQRFPIALVQIKAGNNSKKLLNEIRQIV